jgi:hypothetical protein
MGGREAGATFMKLRILLLCVAAVAAFTVAYVMWPTGSRPLVERAADAPGTTAVSDVGGSPRKKVAASDSATPPERHDSASALLPTAPPRSIPATEVLAMVNRTPITLPALTPVRAGETEKDLTREEYRSRLQRAIEVELVFQAARAESVELTAAQQQRLGKTGEENQAELERYKSLGVTWSSIGPAQVEFEKRLLTAQMLEQNLVLKKAGVYPSPDPAIQALYEQARRELLDQLGTSAEITKAVPAL